MIFMVFIAPVLTPDWKLVVAYRTRIEMSFSNKERGLDIIILILLVNFLYSIELLLQNIRCRHYSKATFRTRIALEEVLFGQFLV